jgi:hypothetical protein
VKFDLVRPCKHCPFRTDTPPFLNPSRVWEIGLAITDGDSTFACHKTVEHDEDGEHIPKGDEQHCAGAAILLMKLEMPNQMMRIAERIGMFDSSKLDMDAPVYDSIEEMADAQPRGRGM